MPRALDPLEVLWSAGFWEGEGSVSIRSVTASQTSTWPLHRLVATFGGRILAVKRYPQRPLHKTCYQWWICGQEARDFVEAIYPHLSPRRQKQIDERFIREAKRRRHRESRYGLALPFEREAV